MWNKFLPNRFLPNRNWFLGLGFRLVISNRLLWVINRQSVIATLVGLVLTFTTHSVYAKAMMRAQVRPAGQREPLGYALIVNGMEAIVIKESHGRLSPFKQASIAAEKLNTAFAKGIPKISIAKEEKYLYSILADDQRILRVTRIEAKRWRVVPEELAAKWAGNLEKALSIPPISVGDNLSLRVPLLFEKRISISGYARGPISLVVANPDVATVKLVADGRSLQVLGKTIGETVLTVSRDGEVLTLPISVMKGAFMLLEEIRAQVTGFLAPGSVIRKALRNAVSIATLVESGATMDWRLTEPNIKLKEHSKAKVNLNLRGQGLNVLPLDLTVLAIVENSPVPMKEEKYLYFSNDPERFSRYGPLLNGILESQSATRIMLHHTNIIGNNAEIRLNLMNLSSQVVLLHIVDGLSPSAADPIRVGLVGSQEFFGNYFDNVGYVARIPPLSTITVDTTPVKAFQTVSGIYYINNLSPEDIHFTVAASDPTFPLLPPAIGTEHLERAFLNPTKIIRRSYRVGDAWSFLPIGKEPLKNRTDTAFLNGNYGVLYNISYDLINPYNREEKVTIAMVASGGPTAGLFLVDGEWVRVNYVDTQQERILKVITLRPKSERTIRILTTPLGGSFYPVTIVVRSDFYLKR